MRTANGDDGEISISTGIYKPFEFISSRQKRKFKKKNIEKAKEKKMNTLMISRRFVVNKNVMVLITSTPINIKRLQMWIYVSERENENVHSENEHEHQNDYANVYWNESLYFRRHCPLFSGFQWFYGMFSIYCLHCVCTKQRRVMSSSPSHYKRPKQNCWRHKH